MSPSMRIAVVQQRFAVAGYADEVAQSPLPYPLAHGGAAEDQRFDAQEPRFLGQVNLEAAVDGALVEQDGFLRQPLEGGALGDGQAGADVGRGVGRACAVEAFGGLGGDGGLGVGA